MLCHDKYTQNATQTLLMRYSRGVLNEKYHPGSVVLMTECCKLIVCSLIVYGGFGETNVFDKNKNDHTFINRIIFLIKNSGYTWVPTTCYFIQNSLQYVASENLSSSVYAVLQQMKILSAAIASVIMLRKQLSWNKWRALFLLCSGGLLMEYHTFEMNDEGHLQNNNDPVKGTAAILTIVGLSGFAGYFISKYIHFMSKYINFLSKYIHFISKYIHFISKYINFISKYIHFISKYISFISKYINFISKYIHFISKYINFLSKYTFYVKIYKLYQNKRCNDSVIVEK